jgi:purine nucleosidase
VTPSPAAPEGRDAIPVHIDTDPGVDDLLALAVALASPEIRVVGITTVAGNAPLDAVTENARRFLTLAGTRVAVGRGAARPRTATPVTAAHIHGEDGRLGVSLPDPTDGEAGTAQDVLRSSLEERGARAVVALGPLTNVAEALERTPDLGGAEIIWMGGSLSTGNVTPLAEFNCYVDPDAADLVLRSGVPVRVVGLDVTREVVLRGGDMDSAPFGRGARGRALHDLVSRLMEAEERARGEACAILHDPCAVAVLAAPDRFGFEERRLAVLTGEGPERGRLVESERAEGRPVR